MSHYKTVIRGSCKEYTKDGRLHKEDGPALEFFNGDKAWFLNGEIHRDDGPAIECHDGTKEWFKEGKLHREDGPAIEHPDGSVEWYLNDCKLTEEEFNKKVGIK